VRAIALAVVVGLAAATPLRPDADRLNAAAAGLLESNTLFTVYGRGFGVAPILGRLGSYKNIDQMSAATEDWVAKIKAVNGGRGVVTGIHLIYALATPCKDAPDCLEYLRDSNVVENYIKPAAARGWTVILDDQLGRSDPVTQIRRMIDRGLLKYDNVHVALDPEFHVVPGHDDPGIPIGTVEASQVNAVQEMLDHYVAAEGLKTKKILIVHQFGDRAVHDGVPFMIQDKQDVRDYPNVELVINADGLGLAAEKVRKYNLMTSSKIYPLIHFRGIKVFLENPYEHAGHIDKQPMTVDQVFGVLPVPGGLRMDARPNVFIIA
jgi:hypothetical protein